MTNDAALIAQLQQENEQLRQRVAALENSQYMLQAVLDAIPAFIYCKDLDGTFLVVNQTYESSFGISREQIIGKNQADFFPSETVAEWRSIEQQVLETRAPVENENSMLLPDGMHTYLSIMSPIFDEHGQIHVLCGIATDITERKQMEEERLSLQQQVIDAQRDALRELSTPLIPIARDVVIMPLIGTIDSGRAQMVLETLLEGVAQYQADLAILDITGVAMVDTQVAQALMRAAQAVKLLGAQVIVTGIQPPIAQMLVHLGVDLEGIITYATLQAGIAQALAGRLTAD